MASSSQSIGGHAAGADRSQSGNAGQPAASAGRRTRMRKLAVVAVTAAVAVLAGCGSSASSSSAAAAPSSGPAAPGTAPNLAPLTLGHFPGTADGKLAKGICEQWQGLRQEYVYRLTIDSPYQMNQWFSSSAWAKEYALANELDGAPAYSNLQGALGVATVGDDAGDAVAAEVDKACEKAD